ncbi:hypothetical protein AGMMS49975_26800 [Clostridia bacterium]|nr:hypothetical protein AGMMS49975_26800 [Clostridia bacterium]
MVFDQNGNVVGRYVTDNNGVIDFTGVLSEGRYTIRETKCAPGYYLDEMPKTIEFVSGKMTEIRWENTPQMSQIQITKRSGDDNEVNGLPKGSPLADAVFEVYAYKSGNLVDRFISGADGRAVSKPLPIGRYLVKEVQAPQWYKISDQVMDVELEFATQIVKLEYLNYSANTGVTIRKTGVYEAMSNDTIYWDIKELQNTSTITLTDFFWRDIVPTDAVRLTKIVTGTYNQSDHQQRRYKNHLRQPKLHAEQRHRLLQRIAWSWQRRIRHKFHACIRHSKNSANLRQCSSEFTKSISICQ